MKLYDLQFGKILPLVGMTDACHLDDGRDPDINSAKSINAIKHTRLTVSLRV